MKTRITLFTLVACALMFSSQVNAQPQLFTAHYPAGVEGVKGGSLPPPGLYLRDYNLFYWSDDLKINPEPEFDVRAVAFAPRLVWITHKQVLGGFYGADVLVPFGWIKSNVAGNKERYFGLGDIFVEPITISWHPKKFDAGVGYGFWAPSGDHKAAPLPLLWKGYWTHMFTLGGTWYPDAEKTWSVSLLNRYEINHEHKDIDVTAGQALTMEWGISKAITKTIEVGVCGYYQQQTTKDKGSASNNDARDRVLALGPEINLFCPKLGLFTSVRYNYEIEAHDRPKGQAVTLTLTKRF